MGRFGETLAARFLIEKGLRVVDANVQVPSGEIDLVAIDRGERVAVEVRTITGPADPIDAVDEAKRRHVAALARRAGAGRVDFVGIRLHPSGFDVHWLPGEN